MSAGPAASVEPDAVARWIAAQRWYASKSRAIAELRIEEAVEVCADPPLTVLIAQARFADGSTERYQLPLSLLDGETAGARPVVADAGDRIAVDALTDPELARGLLRAMAADLECEGTHGALRFRTPEPSPGPLPIDGHARPMGVEQSNSSIVYGETTVLKVLRRLEPGTNPELEMLRFLTARSFASIAPLHGWYEYAAGGPPTTLGVAQRFLGDAVDGWTLTLERIREDPGPFTAELGALGRVIAELHNALASDADDADFAPTQPSDASLLGLVADVDGQIERVFARLGDDARVTAIAGRGEEVRRRLRESSQTASGGRLIRTHGDLHLGQVLHRAGRTGADAWVVIDFEGEPARPLSERRQKASPLRDVAGMLRSFAYAGAATAILHERPAPDGFERRVREAFLTEYLSTIEPSLLPAGAAAVLNLLAILELEKAIYELGYELDNRPDWLPIPVAGIAQLLEAE